MIISSDSTELNIFQVFPNPACSSINVDVAPFDPSDQILVLEMGGKIVKQFKVSSNSSNYDISNLSDGVYQIKYLSQKNTQTKRIIKISQ